MYETPKRGRRAARLAITVALVAAVGLPFTAPARAGHVVGLPVAPYSGFAAGSTLHLDALTLGDLRVANVDVGVANAATNSQGLGRLLNAYQRPIVPADAGKHSLARSSIAELGALSAPDADAILKPFEAELRVPGALPPIDKTALDLPVADVAYVSLANSKAQADWNDSGCVLGKPLSQASEHLARVQLVDTAADATTKQLDHALVGIDADDPSRALTHTLSQQQLYVSPRTGKFGLRSLVQLTIAPVTVLKGTPNEFQIEVGGPAFLDVRADGAAGGADVQFRAPLIRVTRAGSVLAELPSNPPVQVQIPGQNDDVIAELKISALDPISADRGGLGDVVKAGDGTVAAAMANVLQLRILDMPSLNFTGATLGLGHMEARAQVPAGGIDCPLQVAKVANPTGVFVPDPFTTTITVTNPYLCPVGDLSLTDDVTTTSLARYVFQEVRPAADGSLPSGIQSASNLKWSNLGTLAPGASTQVSLKFGSEMPRDSSGNRVLGSGLVKDTATASAIVKDCAIGEPQAGVVVLANAQAKVQAAGVASTSLSTVAGSTTPRTGPTTAATALSGLGLVSLATVGQALVRRRRR